LTAIPSRRFRFGVLEKARSKKRGSKMSKKLFYDPQHWRDRAEDARKVAAQILDRTSKQTMLEIAESYESLARRAAQRLQEPPKQK
jgi:hypothetical protein